MSVELYLAFAGATALLFVTPGPAMSLILANSAARGAGAGLMTAAGSTLGFALLLAVVAAGMAWIVEVMAHWFDWIRIAGAAYLIWLGFTRLRAGAGLDTSVKAVRSAHFREGVTVAIANPKVLLFLGAFFPPFINPSGNVGLQLTVLSVTFLVLSMAFGAGLALMGARARKFFSGAHAQTIERLSGAVLVGAGLWLALAKR